MITSKTLLITILCFTGLLENQFISPVVKDCESFKVSFEVSEKNNDHSLDITINGGQAPYKIILSRETGELVTEDFSQKHFDSLKSGKYFCVAIDYQNCKRKLEITVP